MTIASTDSLAIGLGPGAIIRHLRTPIAEALLVGDGAVAQVSTITFSSPDNSSPYSVSVTDPDTGLSETVAITTDGSATAAEASALMLAAWKIKPLAFGLFSIADDGAGVNTLTARTKNKAITVAEVVDTGSHMAIATATAAAAATTYTLARAIERYRSGGLLYGRVPVQPTRGTITFTVTHAATSTYQYNIAVKNAATGELANLAFWASSGANVTATGAAVVTAIEAVNNLGTGLIDASAATPSGSDVAITITLPTGWTIEEAMVPIVAGSGAASTTPAQGTAGGTVPELGLIYDPGDSSSDTLGTGARTTLRPGTTIPAIYAGAAVLVSAAAAPTAGAPVLVDFGASGALTPTASVTTAPLAGRGGVWKFTGESQVIGSSTYYVAEAA